MVGNSGSHFETKPAATVAQAAPIPKTKPAATIIQAVTTEDHSEGFAVVQNDPVLDRRSETTVGQAATEDYFQADCRQRFSRHCPSMREQRCHSMRCQPGLCNHNQTGQAMCCYLRSKFGYFIPSGAGGAGVPLVGKYSRVYPQDPHYFVGLGRGHDERGQQAHHRVGGDADQQAGVGALADQSAAGL